MSVVINFLPSVGIALLISIFVVMRPAVFVVSSSEQSVKFLPTVSLTLFRFSFCG